MKSANKGAGRLRSIFRSQSIFYKVFGVLFVLVLIILLSLTQFLWNVIDANKSENLHTANLLRLQQAADHVDLSFSLLEANMVNRMWDRDFVSYQLNPGKEDAFRDTRMLTALYNEATGNSLTKHLYLYSAFSDTLFTSSRKLISANDRRIQPVLAEYLALDLTHLPLSDARTRSTVQMMDGRLFLFVDYCLTTRLSTLICEIDLDRLYRSIGGGGENTICVFDSRGEAVFESVRDYDITADNLAFDNLFLSFRDNAPEVKKGALYYSYASPVSGWRYVSPVDRELSQASILSIVGLILPLLLFLLFLSVVFSLYISASVYRPINRLVSLLTEHGTVPPAEQAWKRKNEFDYLEQAYTTVIDEKEKVDAFIQDFSGRFLEDLLKRILAGKVYNEEYLSSILENIGSPFAVQGRFVVMIGHATVPEDRPHPFFENNLYVINIFNMIQGIQTDGETVLPLYMNMEQDEIVVVIGAGAESSVTKVKGVVYHIKQTVQGRIQEFPYSFTWGTSNIYNQLHDLHLSYKDAQNDLQHQLYFKGESPKDRDEAADQDDSIYLKGQMQHFLSDIGTYSGQEGEATLIRLIREGKEKAQTLSQARALFAIISDALMEKLIALHMPEDKLAQFQIADALDGAETVEAMALLVQDACLEALRLIFTQIKTTKFAYVEEAKAYIARHYSENTLSQNDVAEHIGISTSYLSDQFRAVTRQTFPQYLNMYRVEQAKQMLSATKLSIKEVGYHCGFTSDQNFIRVFKKYTTMTPGQYRVQK